jgi:hypothetical protein
MIGPRVAFRGAFGPHEGIVLEETEGSVILKVENSEKVYVATEHETGNTCPQCAGGPLVSLYSFLNRGSEPTGCALGAQPDC